MYSSETELLDETQYRLETIQYLTKLVVDDKWVRSYIEQILRTHKFEADYVPDDGASPVGELWYNEYSNELLTLLREVQTELVYEPNV